MDFRVKICGITNMADACAAAGAGADAIGLNFYERSLRRVGMNEAQGIVRGMHSDVTCVAVFVNASADEIRDTCRQAAIRVVQLHGDEPPALLNSLQPEFEVIRARRLDKRGMQAVRQDLLACRAAGGAPNAILLDAAVRGEYGGTGQLADWSSAASYREWVDQVPLILAGGLRPDNVAAAIRSVRPQAVDTASGVESRPGIKNHELVRQFVAAAQRAFATL